MKILLAEDDPGSLRLLESTLNRWGHETECYSNGEKAWAALNDPAAPKLAILDWMMPGVDGVEICKRIRQRDAESYVYTILLTARSGRQDLTLGMTAGADDYIVKPFDKQELKGRLGAGIRILTLHQELAEMREALEEQARRDVLTGVLNRRAFFDQLDREWARAIRYGHPLTCVLLDLDNFKGLNDNYGHLLGDAALVQVGQVLQRHTRAEDYVGRYGGEEFCVLMPHTTEEQAANWSERARGEIAAIILESSQGPVEFTASFGVAERSPRLPAPNQLIDMADQAMFHSKENGRNQVSQYNLSFQQAT